MSPPACGSKQLLIQANLDGELDAGATASLVAHIAECRDCAELQEELAGLSRQVRQSLTRHPAPAALRQTLQRSAPSRAAIRPNWRDGGWFAAGMAVAASIALLALPQRQTHPEQGDALVAAHIRALQPGHLLDVVSTDRHTVKPWFDGRLDFAPPVPDLAAEGFPLVGGRLDYLEGRPVAALVYRRNRHLIDLFIWPGAQAGRDRNVRGYAIESWSRDGMNFHAVSDLNDAEFARFRELLLKPD
nr:anti-sigma factor [uncultured Lichenicoccus sp.]